MKVVSLTCVLASLSSLKSSPPPGRAAFLKKILFFFSPFSLFFLSFFLFFPPLLFFLWNEPRKNRWRISGRPSRRELPLWKVASLNHPETFKGRDLSIAGFLNVRSGRRRKPESTFQNMRIHQRSIEYIFPHLKQSMITVESLNTFHRFRLIENDRRKIASRARKIFKNFKNHGES